MKERYLPELAFCYKQKPMPSLFPVHVTIFTGLIFFLLGFSFERKVLQMFINLIKAKKLKVFKILDNV